ncbi:YdiU family protein [Corynebacterium qintianiae]|uniref:Protein nucleotidyltransferase YdiU n=1 Tax=Corynebacterium qintianiae TaxID=2709392 RepID=A0A7T0KKQ7_9CORY|nr:protein adenylyltransferase SelO family protein [Corynebacterium qintianiae]QPK82581.1 YdiU family protein [Corynebacterium qintianiae]
MSAPTLAHTFAEKLPEMAVEARAADFAAPRLVVLNEPLARELGLDPDWLRTDDGVAWLAGAAGGHATAYAGHQFGQFVPLLGDGRALLLGDLGGREIQLKGSGPTPFSRPGSDGFGAIGPMLREYLVCEFMQAVGIPTTRSLAVLDTGERVLRQQGYVPGGIVVRVAASHLRVGSVQYAATQSEDLIAAVVEAAGFATPLRMLSEVMDRQLELVVRWMRIGFVHGVMNTDNTALSGETIDYGPCAFTERFVGSARFSSIDSAGRYAFGNQPNIIAWNLTRLAEALLPLTGEDSAREVLGNIQNRWDYYWEMHFAGVDKQLATATDITTFNRQHSEGPIFIPRNQMLQRAITDAERDGDYNRYFELLNAVTDPFNPEAGPWWMKGSEGDDPFITYCGT